MRRWLLAAALVLAGCGDDTPADSSKGESTVEQGKALQTVAAGRLTACVDPGRAPFAYDSTGELRGIDVDLVRAVTGRLALSAEFRRTEDPVGDLKAGRCDVAPSAEEDDEVDRTAAYFEVREAIVVRAGEQAAYDDMEKLRGKPVAFPFEAGPMVYAADFGAVVTVRQFPTAAEAVAALAARQVEAVVVDQPVGLYYAKANGDVAVAKVFEDVLTEYAVAVRQGDAAMRKAVDDALTQIRADDSFRMILTQHLGTTTL